MVFKMTSKTNQQKETVLFLKKMWHFIWFTPQRTNLSILLSNQQEYYQITKTSENIKTTDQDTTRKHGKIQNFEWTHDFKIPRNSTTYQPGFDFSEEEIKKLKLWKQGLIPYYIDVPSFTDKVLRDGIRWYLNKVNSDTSLNFVELPRPPSDYDKFRWVFFINRQGLLGCADHCIKNFTNTGVQRVVLGYDCISTGQGLADAVLAIAGIPPQHNAPNRDDYITILEENIKPEKLYLYQKLKDNEWLFHDLVYDFESAGHVSYHKHSSNGRATFMTKVPHKNTNIGDTHGFSSDDILKLRMLYNYIANKREDKGAHCSKLFMPRKLPKNASSNMKGIVKTLPKPTKYLGIEIETDTEQSNNNSEEYNNEETKSYENKKEKKSKSYLYENNKCQGRQTINTNYLSNYKKRSDNQINMKGGNIDDDFGVNNEFEKSLTMRKPLKLDRDPLTYLSDYNTEEEATKRIAWQKKG